MDEKVTIALISGGAALAGASITAMVAYLSAREKTQQLDHAYRRELSKEHLENARKHVDTIYIPLGKALSLFSDRFRSFQTQVNLDDTSDTANTIPSSEITNAIRDLQELLSALRARGAEVFMIPELDEELGGFASFLDKSLTAGTPTIKVVVSVDFSSLGFSTSLDKSVHVSSSKAAHLRGRFSIAGFPVGMTYNASEILAAPIISKEFVDNVSSTLPVLKTLIKVVTLGPESPR